MQADNNIADANSNAVVVGRLQANETSTGGADIANDQLSMRVVDKSCNMAADIASQGVVANNCEFSDVCKESGDYMLTKSDAGLMRDVQNTFSQPSLASKELAYGGEPCRVEGSPVGNKLHTVDQIPGFAVAESARTVKDNGCDQDCEPVFTKSFERGTSKRCNGLECIPNELGDATSSTLQENDNISKVSCLYSCCSNCVHAVNVMAHKMISIYLKSNECCCVDDVHDIITSCSLNILASFRKFFISGSNSNLEENCRRLYCETELEEGHNGGFKRMPCRCKALEKMELLPVVCDCDTRIEDDTTLTNGGSASLFESKLTYFFRDSVLVPHVPNEDIELHCNFEKMCICSVVMILHTIKQTFD